MIRYRPDLGVVSAVTNCFEVWYGLRQGCTMTPALFKIYFDAMVTRWCSKSEEAIEYLFCINMRKLVGDPTAKSMQSAGD